MAFLGDLIVKIGANANPFTNALKKAQSMTQTFKTALTDMKSTAAVFAKLAASIKAVNIQMDRLVGVSKRALAATNIQADAERRQFKDRMAQLKAMQSMQPSAKGMFEVAGGIGIANGVSGAVSGLKDMLIGTVKLSASAEVMRSEFAVLLGDVGKSAKFFDELEKFAARTSFNLESAGDAARVLMAAGVSENSLLDTMQLLGDLSLGDANRLGFLSKAYTDVFNKGRLQGQEIKQFAENGVGIVQALAGVLGKETHEILAMSEAGEISFDMMREALQSLTTGTGRFTGAMAARNATLLGQWDSMIEGIQKTGRAIGDNMLPAIKGVVAEANAMLGKFNEMPDKMTFIGDVIESSFDVAFLHIAEKWDQMLIDMAGSAKDLLISGAGEMLMPAWTGDLGGAMEAGKRNADRPKDLEAANKRLEELLGKLQGPAAAGNAAPAAAADENVLVRLQREFTAAEERTTQAFRAFKDAEKAMLMAAPGDQAAATKAAQAKSLFESEQQNKSKLFKEFNTESKRQTNESGGKKLASGASSLWESLQSPIAEAQMAAQGMWDRTKIKAGAAMGTLENIFTGDKKEPEKKIKPRLAGAMQAGSQDAYSTIVQAMIRQADPVVKATEKQTREFVKAIKKIPSTRLAYVAAFEGVGEA